MKFDTINTVSADPFMVTWDTGRRCNYDCTYCAPIHHDNFSPHASFDTLKDTASFIFKYVDLITKYRKHNDVGISLTGGEPTANPNFLKLVHYLKEQVDNRPGTHLSLTTNGTMGKRLTQAVSETFKFVTISYHTEADVRLKKNVISRIKQLHALGTNVKVNVMFHAHYFDECIDICNQLKQDGIPYTPRTLGENPAGEKDYGHQYTEEQQEWIRSFWNIPKEESKNNFGAELGRPCCGGRCMSISNDSETKEVKFLTYRKFKDWYCSVNWFFLHIEQQTDSVYHHQTCQARFDGTAGPIGKISEGNLILQELENNLTNNTMPIIQCPNSFCGCGMCTPKSSSKETLLSIIGNNVDASVFG